MVRTCLGRASFILAGFSKDCDSSASAPKEINPTPTRILFNSDFDFLSAKDGRSSLSIVLLVLSISPTFEVERSPEHANILPNIPHWLSSVSFSVDRTNPVRVETDSSGVKGQTSHIRDKHHNNIFYREQRTHTNRGRACPFH